MKPRNTLILALVVAILGAFVWLYEIRGADERADAEAAGKRVFAGVEATEIESIVLRTTDGHPARLVREEGGWRLQEPVSFAADTAAADGIAAALAGLDAEATFDDPAPLPDYGLVGEPRARFEVGGTEYTLSVGDKSPVGGNSYVTRGAGDTVYAVATWRTSALQKSLDELREKRILDFDRDAVQQIRVTWPDAGVLLERADEGWRLKEPFVAEADAQAVDDLLSDLTYLRASGFDDDPPTDLASVGLTAPALEIELSGPAEAGGTPLAAALAFGSTTEAEMRSVRGTVDGVLYRVPAERIEDFPRRVTAYRERDLASFDSADAQSFELVFHDEAAAQSRVVTGTRGDEGWSSEPEAIDRTRASTLIARLSRLQAEEIAAETASDARLADLGLAPPRVLVRVQGAAAADAAPLLAEVELGVADPERGIAARRAGDERVWWLDYDLAEQVPITLEAFRNRFLAEEPEPAPAPVLDLEDAPGVLLPPE